MRVAVTGSHGLLGRHLLPALEAAGHEVVPVVRGGTEARAVVAWDPAAGTIAVDGLAGVDAAVHLAGGGIGDRRWTPAHKRAVRQSRVEGTSLLSETLARLRPRPGVLLSASAVGYYGDRDDELLDESSPSGSGFLADVCRRWEAATEAAAAAGIRTIHLRSGVVLAGDGGALAAQLPLFRLGLGARLGRGRQWMSWISVDDEVAAIVRLLADETVSGPVNLTAPEPATNATFTATLGRILHRPAVFAAPPFAVKALLGPEMASEMLFASQRVTPAVLQRTGFVWRHAHLDDAVAAAVEGA
ncbi:MAG TPA: TIGR01777 family oxidoreductase [Acidimicrobiales bacterium]|nr:TIGR01777 family oxidoreductase [Acidimicrobiales bacterium]